MSDTTEHKRITDVDDFEVTAEDDKLLVGCPDTACKGVETLATDWHARVGDIIRAARAHEHRYPDRAKETSHG